MDIFPQTVKEDWKVLASKVIKGTINPLQLFIFTNVARCSRTTTLNRLFYLFKVYKC